MKDTTIVVKSYDVFPNGAIKPSALMRYMQQLAREDCDALGCTYDFMRNLNTVFVTTKLGIEFYRPIKVGEVLQMRTYNNEINGIIFDREFDIKIGGEEVAHASTFWVLVKYDDRSLCRPSDFPYEFFSHHLDCKKVDIPRRLAEGDMQTISERVVRVSDLDENNHLNNCVYADITVDSLPLFNGLDQTIRTIKVIYRHEARLNDVLDISLSKAFGKFSLKADNKTSNSVCFESQVEFFDQNA